MRLFFLGLSAISLVVCAGCAEPPPSTPPFTTPPLSTPLLSTKDFSLQAETVEALEGGPVVVSLTLTFQGDQPVDVGHPLLNAPDDCTLYVPKGWERRETFVAGRGCSGSMNGYITIQKGDQFFTTVYLHEQYSLIPSGRTTLKLSWWVARYKGREQEITTTLNLDVPPATPTHLAAVRWRIETVLEQSPLTREVVMDLSRRILETQHRAFVPTALRLIASGASVYSMRPLIRYVYDNSENPEELHTQFVNLAITQNESFAVDLLGYWRDEQVAIDSRYLKKLMGADNIWLRALTYATFGNRCDDMQVKTLLRELSDLKKPIDPDLLARLLVQLDDDQFSVREQASRKLEWFGERVVQQLRNSLDQPLSPEVRKRVGAVLSKLEHPDPFTSTAIVFFLESAATPEATAVLETVAKGSPDSLVGQLAQKCLEKRAKGATTKP